MLTPLQSGAAQQYLTKYQVGCDAPQPSGHMPEVSVVLPVFNGARSIARAVRSILDQTLQEIELIVLDDGSTDGTATVVGDIRDARLRVVPCVHSRRRGGGEYCNRAYGCAP